MRRSAAAQDKHELIALFASRKVLVLGSPGSGKSFLSTVLCQVLGLELIRLDDFFWRPGPIRTPVTEWREIVADLARKPAWIMDGTYEASLDLRVPAADTVIFIESCRWACLWRVCQRLLRLHTAGKKDASFIQPLTLFFMKYVLLFPDVTRSEVMGMISRFGNNKLLILIDGSSGVNRFIRRLKAVALGAKHSGFQV